MKTLPFSLLVWLLVILALLVSAVQAQTTNATVNGLVVDSSGAVVVGASVQAINDGTNVAYPTVTNKEGVYALTNLPPGRYHIQVARAGFKTLIKPDIILNVLDAHGINFTLQVGAASETVTVEGGASLVNTQDASVSTVVDRQFAENLPMNGRSFQTLIQLTPGVVLTPSTGLDSGQFSVDGQRPSSNYWMVDGVSANVGVSVLSPGNGLAGALGSFSAQGGTNSLVSVDAMQEFRIQTSTYAPEFGRTPGGQISIVTRSGTNQFHGALFDYFRNDTLDANDWFADNAGLPKPEERENDFGGTFSGPIVKDRTFFFLSYEGLRLRLPQVAQTTVPDSAARQDALPALQPFLNAFPLDPRQPDLGNGMAQFNASFSNSSTLNATSLRIDHKLKDMLTLFGRYNYSPSDVVQRGNGLSLSTVSPSRITTQTATVGSTWGISPKTANDLRINYSRTEGSSSSHLDNFGGAIPPTSLPLPPPFTSQDSNFAFSISLLTQGSIFVGKSGRNLQRQINIVDDLSLQRGSHNLKFGVDYRRLSPIFDGPVYSQQSTFADVPSAETGNLEFSFLLSLRTATLLFRNLGVFAQDTWRIIPRLTLTYGLRWDVDFAPTSISGPSIAAVTGFNLNDLSSLALAPAGTPPFKTPYGNVAPRLGVAYQLSQSQDWQTVIRGGFGAFFDLATQQAGNFLFTNSYPFGAFSFCPDPSNPACPSGNLTFPLDPATAAPPPIARPGSGSGTVFAFDPNLKLPYTLQWNVALEQALGTQQTISASYLGATGRRLIQSAEIFLPNANFGSAVLVGNTATSYYSALQIQFQRRLSHGLQTLASYTWSHSIDTGSEGSYGNGSNTLVPTINSYANRGSSDFDIRNAFSAGVTYDIPAPKINGFTNAILRGWSLQNVIQARSAPPVNISYGLLAQLLNYYTSIRPDVVAGQPLYLHGPQYPGNRALNPAAFTPPPTDPNTGLPLRQGDLARNALRGFGATQWDFAIHRDFPIHESLSLQFRAEMFNLLNHPNFGPPCPFIDFPNFGRATQMLGQSLNGGACTGVSNLGSGAFSPLYQIGGPRSIQFALKLTF